MAILLPQRIAATVARGSWGRQSPTTRERGYRPSADPDQRAGHDAHDDIEQQGHRQAFDPATERGNAMREDAAAHQEHRGRTGYRQALHEQRRGPEHDRAEPALHPGHESVAVASNEAEPTVLTPDDRRHQAVHERRHEERD